MPKTSELRKGPTPEMRATARKATTADTKWKEATKEKQAQREIFNCAVHEQQKAGDPIQKIADTLGLGRDAVNKMLRLHRIQATHTDHKPAATINDARKRTRRARLAWRLAAKKEESTREARHCRIAAMRTAGWTLYEVADHLDLHESRIKTIDADHRQATASGHTCPA